MTGSDLFVLTRWVIFGAGLAAVMFRLCRSGYSSPRQSPPRQPSLRPEAGAPEQGSRPVGGGRAGSARSRVMSGAWR